MSAEGLAPAHMALLLEIAADAAEQRLSGGVPASLVWTGPESAVSQSRDTAVVVDELFAHAERFVLVSSYVVQKGTIVFRSLAERMVARPGLHVQLFLHIGREWRDTRDESELLREFGAELSSPVAWLASARSVLRPAHVVRRCRRSRGMACQVRDCR